MWGERGEAEKTLRQAVAFQERFFFQSLKLCHAYIQPLHTLLGVLKQSAGEDNVCGEFCGCSTS